MRTRKSQTADRRRTSSDLAKNGSPNNFKKAILVGLQIPGMTEDAVTRSLDELELLVKDLGFSIVERLVQRREVRSAATFIGIGKIKELAKLTGGTGQLPRGPEEHQQRPEHEREFAVIIDDELTPGQHRNLELALDADVMDRFHIILKIFESRAHTREAKLQIEIARLEHQIPHIRDNHSRGDKEGGGGRASRGHSNVELAKQRTRERIASLKKELAQLGGRMENSARSREDLKRVALVGYTNVGKSSLMRMLTGSQVLVKDKLFATLGTTTRQLQPPIVPSVLVTDTVGFIERLPHSLIASFRSTLVEARDAQLILHVIDAAHPHWMVQHQLAEVVLGELGLENTAKWLVFNKVDKLDLQQRQSLLTQYPDALQTSALDASSGQMLRVRIAEFFQKDLSEIVLVLSYAQQGVLTEFSDRVQILNVEYSHSIKVVVRGTDIALAQLQARLSAT
jgi:GTP-binding protein HflX